LPARVGRAPCECGFERLAFVGLLSVRKEGEATGGALASGEHAAKVPCVGGLRGGELVRPAG
jgi:hypothetical protein